MLVQISIYNHQVLIDGANLFVDDSVTGSSETGGESDPCLSISKCVYSLANNGDIIYVKPGTGNGYTGNDNTDICALRGNCNFTSVSLIGLGDPAMIIWYAESSKFSERRALVVEDNRFIYIANLTITGFKFNVPSADYSNFRYAGGAIQVKNS